MHDENDELALLQKALKNGQGTLSEYDSKSLLRSYGIPTVEERAVHSESEAEQAAEELGFPIVLKGSGWKLTHKSERGLVHLGLHDHEALRSAFRSVSRSGGEDLEEVLLQPQVEARRELVAGMFRDPQFGPVIMFGLGGIYTEALSDVSFRLAPLNLSEARTMLRELRSSKLLGAFRGEAPADEGALLRTLTALSRVGLEQPQIEEIDINPLLITQQGRVVAVDGLVALGRKKEERSFPPPVPPQSIARLFSPKSVAFIGASARMGKWGHLLTTNVLSGDYRGKVFFVNPKGGTMSGQPVYTSVGAIPEPVDLAVVTIPASQVLDLLPELQEKGISHMVLIASGFSEAGPKGRELEEDLVRRARELGILIMGPNTMGLCNPHISFYCTGSIVHPRAGSTAMVSQSGNMGVQLLSFAEQQGIGIRGFCGSGNEAMLTIEDYLDGLAEDEETQTLMLYVESVKNGSRFFESAKKVSSRKPIVLLKGGETDVGHKAAASHTGALSSDAAVFSALCKQAGIIKVDGPMDLLDLTAAFSSLPLPRGNRVAIMTLGGGWGVITADLCAKYGLAVPELSRELVESFDALLPDYWSRSNPVDLVGERDLELPVKVLKRLLAWDGCDAVINLGILGRKVFVAKYTEAIARADASFSREALNKANETLAQFEAGYVHTVARLMEEHGKPIFGVRLQNEGPSETVIDIPEAASNSVFYPTPENAVKACATMYTYYQFLKQSQTEMSL